MDDGTRSREREIDALFARALEEDVATRAAFVERNCVGDRELADAVMRLLEFAERSDESLRPGGALAGEVWAELAGLTEQIAAAASPPTNVGPYRVVREIGRGGMAVVYLAERSRGDFQQRVAIKVIQAGMGSEAVLKRFSQERTILASLNHPAIAKLFDGGSTDDGRPFFAMELVEGDPIDRYCVTHRLALPERLRLFLVVARAVQYAHRNLVVHRDLKASNIMVTHDGQVKLLDFGIAKLLDPAGHGDSGMMTLLSAVPMTPRCASPEQIRGESITTATDVYQLGLLLYQLLTGRYPYRVDPKDRRSLAKAICEQEPTRPSTAVRATEEAKSDPAEAVRSERLLRRHLKGDLDSIVLMALRKEPEKRYASVDHLAEDIERHLRGLPVHACRGTFSYRASKFLTRNSRAVSATAAVVILFIAVTSTYLHLLATERDRAELEAENAKRTSEVLFNLFETADPELGAGEQANARELLERGRAQVATELRGQPAVQAAAMAWIGQIYGKLGVYDRARESLEDALDQRLELHGELHPEVADTLEQLAQVHQDADHYEEATVLYERALAIRERTLEPDHLLVATSLGRVGNLKVRSYAYEEAEELLERALAIQERALGGDNAELAQTLNDLSWLHYERGDFTAGWPPTERALALTERAFGVDHPKLLRPLYYYAALLQLHGDYAESRSAFERLLRIIERAYGRTSWRVAQILSELAITTRLAGYLEQAAVYATEAVEIRAAVHGTENYRYAAASVVLADVYLDAGRYAAAEPLYLSANAIYEQDAAVDPFFVAGALTGLGNLELAKGDHARALDRYQRALALRQRTRGSSHPEIAQLLTQIGTAETMLGRLADAEHTLRTALEMNRQWLPATHRQVAEASLALGRLLRRRGAMPEADRLVTEALAIFERGLPPDHPSVLAASALLAD